MCNFTDLGDQCIRNILIEMEIKQKKLKKRSSWLFCMIIPAITQNLLKILNLF